MHALVQIQYSNIYFRAIRTMHIYWNVCNVCTQAGFYPVNFLGSRGSSDDRLDCFLFLLFYGPPRVPRCRGSLGKVRPLI
jgi:hypothetical protein